MFTDSVAYTLDVKKYLIKFVKKNLNTAPVAPPVATRIKLNNIPKLEIVVLILQ